MIDDAMVVKAIKHVYGRLYREYRRRRLLAGLDADETPVVPADVRESIRGAAVEGVTQAIKDYKADRKGAIWLWLIISGEQRAVNVLRAENTHRVGKKYRQIPKGGPEKPFCASDLAEGETHQFEKATTCDGNPPFPLDLFNHPCLTENERAVLIGHYAENRTWNEVADNLGIPERTCRRRHTSALKKLHRVLGEKP